MITPRVLGSGLAHAGPALRRALRVGPPVALWPLDDAAGSATARDAGPNNFAGTPTDVTFGQAGPDVARPAASFNGTSSEVNIYNAGLNTAWNGNAFTAAFWAKFAAAAWIDGTRRRVLALRVSGTNEIYIDKSSSNHILQAFHVGGGTSVNVSHTFSPAGPTTWFHLAVTVSGGSMQLYINGAPSGSPTGGLGTFAGSLDPARTRIGSSGIGLYAAGDLALVGLYAPLTADKIAYLKGAS